MALRDVFSSVLDTEFIVVRVTETGGVAESVLTPLCHALRSVTMDAWSGDQLRKMQLGGNDSLNIFLKKYGVDKFTDIKEKYSSQGAEVRFFCWMCASSARYRLARLFARTKNAVALIL